MVSNQPGTSATNYVEVYDEPEHRSCLVNDYVHVYRVQLPPGQTTLWHRHCEDTVYFSLGSARAGEQFPAAESVVTDIPCGAAVSRPHRTEPLIHKVTNQGTAPFHLIGAEAHKRPAESSSLVSPSEHELLLETERFRVYRIACEQGFRLSKNVCGLFVATAPCALIVASEPQPRDLASGELLWLDEACGLSSEAACSGFFAQWC